MESLPGSPLRLPKWVFLSLRKWERSQETDRNRYPSPSPRPTRQGMQDSLWKLAAESSDNTTGHFLLGAHVKFQSLFF